MGFFPFQPEGGGGGAVDSVFGRTGTVTATSGDYAVGQVTGAAPLASPAFTGTPAGPTAAAGTSTTQLATTAFVEALAANKVIWLVPSGDVTGAADAAAINSAVTSVAGLGSAVIALLPVAPWYIECAQVVINRSGLYLQATGCILNAVGAGTMIDMHDSADFETRTVHGGGWIAPGPVIDGTATTGSSAPFHGGDILQLGVFFRSQNFTAGTTSKGCWLDNRFFWTEQAYGRVFTENCTAGTVFDVSAGNTTNTGSFERCNLELYTDQGLPASDGVVFQNGAFVQDGILGLYGNFGTSASPLTSAALRITGSTPAGVAQAAVSNISNSVLNIGYECDQVTGSNAPFSVFFGSGSNYVTLCTGNIDFGAAFAFQPSNSSGNFNFAGNISGDDTLQSVYVMNQVQASQIALFGAIDAGTLQADAFGNLQVIPADANTYDAGQLLVQTTAPTNGTTGTAAQNVTGLVTPPLLAGAVYHLDILLSFEPTVAGGVTNFGLAAGAGLTLSAISMGSLIGGMGTSAEAGTAGYVTSTSLSATMWASPTRAGTSGFGYCHLWGKVTVNAAGTLQVVFANGTSADTATVAAGATMLVRPAN